MAQYQHTSTTITTPVDLWTKDYTEETGLAKSHRTTPLWEELTAKLTVNTVICRFRRLELLCSGSLYLNSALRAEP